MANAHEEEKETHFYSGNELGTEEASKIFSARYGHLVGILGTHGTGKTCLLCSLYLLASCGDLRPQTLFAGSLTLPGFETRLRRLRSWPEGGLPDQIVDHTILADPRKPSLLHLALLETTPTRHLRDIFFTDLPGEWTTDLINRAAAARRFGFFRRADAIVIAIPAPELLAEQRRHAQVQSIRVLLQRLAESVGIDRRVPIVLAITRCDLTGADVPPDIHKITEFGVTIGFNNISYVPIAAFSERPEVPSGMGLGTLLETILRVPTLPKSVICNEQSDRMFARYRHQPKVTA